MRTAARRRPIDDGARRALAVLPVRRLRPCQDGLAGTSWPVNHRRSRSEARSTNWQAHASKSGQRRHTLAAAGLTVVPHGRASTRAGSLARFQSAATVALARRPRPAARIAGTRSRRGLASGAQFGVGAKPSSSRPQRTSCEPAAADLGRRAGGRRRRPVARWRRSLALACSSPSACKQTERDAPFASAADSGARSPVGAHSTGRIPSELGKFPANEFCHGNCLPKTAHHFQWLAGRPAAAVVAAAVAVALRGRAARTGAQIRLDVSVSARRRRRSGWGATMTMRTRMRTKMKRRMAMEMRSVVGRGEASWERALDAAAGVCLLLAQEHQKFHSPPRSPPPKQAGQIRFWLLFAPATRIRCNTEPPRQTQSAASRRSRDVLAGERSGRQALIWPRRSVPICVDVTASRRLGGAR
jgi:hypothetical protein